MTTRIPYSTANSVWPTPFLGSSPLTSETSREPDPTQTNSQTQPEENQPTLIQAYEYGDFDNQFSFELGHDSSSTNLETLKQQFQASIQAFSQQKPETFKELLRQAYGEQVSQQQLNELLKQAQAGNLPMPEVVWTPQLGEAYGAYTEGTIHLNPVLTEQPETLAKVFAEEMGHYLDQQLNSQDSPGDEGRIFAQGLQQQAALEPEQLNFIRQQNDHGSLQISEDTSLDAEFATPRQLWEADRKRIRAQNQAMVPGLILEYQRETQPLKRARLLIKIADKMDLLGVNFTGRLYNQTARYLSNPASFDARAQKEFQKSFSDALKQTEKLNAAFNFNDAGFFENLAQIIQLGDIGFMQDFSKEIKGWVLNTMDTAVESGMNETGAVLSASAANSIIDLLLPTNVVDLPGFTKLMGKGLTHSIEASKNIKALLNKQVEGVYVVKKGPAGYEIRYGAVKILSQNERKMLILMKYSELEKAKTAQDLERIKTQLGQLLAATTKREDKLELLRFLGELSLSSTGSQAIAFSEREKLFDLQQLLK